jgi:hypothetical protein
VTYLHLLEFGFLLLLRIAERILAHIERFVLALFLYTLAMFIADSYSSVELWYSNQNVDSLLTRQAG